MLFLKFFIVNITVDTVLVLQNALLPVSNHRHAENLIEILANNNAQSTPYCGAGTQYQEVKRF